MSQVNCPLVELAKENGNCSAPFRLCVSRNILRLPPCHHVKLIKESYQELHSNFMLREIVFSVWFPTLNSGFNLNLTFNTLSPSYFSNTAVLNLGRTMDSLGETEQTARPGSNGFACNGCSRGQGLLLSVDPYGKWSCVSQQTHPAWHRQLILTVEVFLPSQQMRWGTEKGTKASYLYVLLLYRRHSFHLSMITAGFVIISYFIAINKQHTHTHSASSSTLQPHWSFRISTSFLFLGLSAAPSTWNVGHVHLTSSHQVHTCFLTCKLSSLLKGRLKCHFLKDFVLMPSAKLSLLHSLRHLCS